MPRSDPAAERQPEIEVREVELADVTDLRGRVLRSGMPGAPATASTDGNADVLHLGAFRAGRLVGVVTTFAEEAPGNPGVPAARFRFMAVEPSEQGSGAGTALMGELMARARARGSRLLWANGRDTALAFYARLDFAVVGEGFDDPATHLPHHVVIREL